MSRRSADARTLVAVAGIAAVLAACGGSSGSEADATLDRAGWRPDEILDVDGAVAVGIATAPSGYVWLAWTTDAGVHVRPFTGDGEPARVNGDAPVFAHPVERPALHVGPGDELTIAWTGLDSAGNGAVHRARLSPGATPGEVQVISGPPEPETNLVHMAPTASGPPVYTWLQDSTLSIASTGADGTVVEAAAVDDLTCDCCNPAPLEIGGQVAVAYRNLEESPDGDIRDVFVVRAGRGGDGFEEPVRVADEHWYLDGCPFSGPSMVMAGDTVLVAWTDARQTLHPEQRSTSVWVDRSGDGGVTFGRDVRVDTGDGVHRWPVLAVEGAGRVHLVWERQSPPALMHAYSTDGGTAFSPPVALVASEAGALRSPSVVVSEGRLVVSWTDSAGGHVGAWPLDRSPR